MTFLNPLMLMALILVVVPFIIYFFINRKKIVLYFAAYIWMKNAQVKRRNQQKINDLLKMISKVLLMLFLAVLVSRPAIVYKKGGSKILIIDNTLSMATLIDNENRLEHAKKLVAKYIQESDTHMAIYSFDGTLKPISSMKKQSSAVMGQVNLIEISPKHATLDDLANSLGNISKTEDYDSICFISDFQKRDYNSKEKVSNIIGRIGADKTLEFIPVDQRTTIKNIALVDYEVSPEGVYPGRENEILVTVANYSDSAVEGIPVSLYVDNMMVDRSIVSLTAGANEKVALSFSAPFNQKDSNIKVVLPADSYPVDNEFNIVFSAAEHINVLGVRANKGTRDFDLDVYFKAALKSISNTTYINYKAITPAELSSVEVANYDMVICYGMAFDTDTLATKNIKSFIEAGKPIISFCDDPKADYWKEFGVEAIPTESDSVRVDGERADLIDSYLGFMIKNELNPNLFQFTKPNLIKVSGNKDLSGKLYVQEFKEPVIAELTKEESKIVLCGFMPYQGSTNIFYNPNFVQMSMRMINSVLNKSLLHSKSGSEVEKIFIGTDDQTDAGGDFTLYTDDDKSQKMGVSTKDGKVYLSTKPFDYNTFCTIKSGKRKVAAFGYNLTRADSAVVPADNVLFAKAIEDGLVYNEQHNFKDSNSKYELLIFILILLIMALGLEYYAHLWTKQQ